MMKEVVISICSLIDYGMEQEDRIEFSSDGVYTYSEERANIVYFESEVTGLQGTRTSVKVFPDRVIVDRRGGLTSIMEFKEGEKNSFLYNTPVGTATMNMNTRRISHCFGPAGGELEIEYVLDMEHTVVSRNKFMLSVREQKKMGV